MWGLGWYWCCRVIPGNALAVAGNMPFRGLDRFGVSFLNKFEVRPFTNHSATYDDLTMLIQL
jgi:hypothetical protein